MAKKLLFSVLLVNRKKMTRKYPQSGFTLVEIMIVASIIALLAAIAVPSFLRARKRSQATRVLEDLRLISDAIDQYAIENNKIGGNNPTFTDLKPYIKTKTRLYNTGRDILGNRYRSFTVDKYPRVPTNTKNALAEVADSTFWSPYQ
jgi:prepilin-type N-terminal cleavage/methylation domain-containing protein